MQIPTVIQRTIPHPPDVRFYNPIGNRSEIWREWFFSENLTNLARMSIQIIHFEERIPQTEGTAVANELQDGAWDLPCLWGGRGTALFLPGWGMSEWIAWDILRSGFLRFGCFPDTGRDIFLQSGTLQFYRDRAPRGIGDGFQADIRPCREMAWRQSLFLTKVGHRPAWWRPPSDKDVRNPR